MPTHSLIPQPARDAASFLVLALACVSLSVVAADTNYTVKRDDTLTDLAQENGLDYHFVIGNGHSMKDGEIAIGRRWTAQLDGGHLASEALNRKAIGICMVGNFDADRPTRRQMESLRSLVEFLLARCHLRADAVKTHQQINPIYTRCPGHNFPTKSFLEELKQSDG